MMVKMTYTMTRLQWGMDARGKKRREGKIQEYEERRDEGRKGK